METMTMYAYIKKRIAGRRTESIVQDLVDDMARDNELEGKTAQEIVNHIRLRACDGAWEATKQFVKQYKQYCKQHNMEAEPVNCR
jgi:arginine utilization protein RocB